MAVVVGVAGTKQLQLMLVYQSLRSVSGQYGPVREQTPVTPETRLLFGIVLSIENHKFNRIFNHKFMIYNNKYQFGLSHV